MKRSLKEEEHDKEERMGNMGVPEIEGKSFLLNRMKIHERGGIKQCKEDPLIYVLQSHTDLNWDLDFSGFLIKRTVIGEMNWDTLTFDYCISTNLHHE